MNRKSLGLLAVASTALLLVGIVIGAFISPLLKQAGNPSNPSTTQSLFVALVKKTIISPCGFGGDRYTGPDPICGNITHSYYNLNVKSGNVTAANNGNASYTRLNNSRLLILGFRITNNNVSEYSTSTGYFYLTFSNGTAVDADTGYTRYLMHFDTGYFRVDSWYTECFLINNKNYCEFLPVGTVVNVWQGSEPLPLGQTTTESLIISFPSDKPWFNEQTLKVVYSDIKNYFEWNLT